MTQQQYDDLMAALAANHDAMSDYLILSNSIQFATLFFFALALGVLKFWRQ